MARKTYFKLKGLKGEGGNFFFDCDGQTFIWGQGADRWCPPLYITITNDILLQVVLLLLTRPTRWKTPSGPLYQI